MAFPSSWLTGYFNPRTREGCDQAARPASSGSRINFNPRTREGCDLGPLAFSGKAFAISIHAPVKGATRKRFNYDPAAFLISIHAPVKGATCYFAGCSLAAQYFNPRTREGCDGLQIGSVTICSLINHIAN